MGHTYRDSWASAHIIFRYPKGHKKALINNARKRAIPPHAWDDKRIGRECQMIWSVARKLAREGKTANMIIDTLISKFNMKYRDAMYVIKYAIK